MTKPKKNLNIMTNIFLPDEIGGGRLIGDLAQFLSDKKWDVNVYCPFSFYPEWKHKDNRHKKWFLSDKMSNFLVHWCRMYVPSSPSGLSRIFFELSLSFSMALRILFSKKVSVSIATSPLLSICAVQAFFCKLRRIPMIFFIQDFSIAAAKETGLIKNNLLLNFASWLEIRIMSLADIRITISREMLIKLNKMIPDRKNILIPNWIHKSLEENINLIDKKNFQRFHKVPFKFVYSGNIGEKQGLEHFISQITKVDGDWLFEIRGGGSARQRVGELLSSLKDDRIKLEPLLNESDFAVNLCESTAVFITQKKGTGPTFHPSKLLPALATGTPVIAICESNTSLAREVIAGNFGMVIDPDNVEQLKSIISTWENDNKMLNSFSKNAINYSSFFNREKILGQFENYLNEILKDKNV